MSDIIFKSQMGAVAQAYNHCGKLVSDIMYEQIFVKWLGDSESAALR